MDLRDKIASGLKDAMKSKDSARLSTLRLINAAIKDREIALRGEGKSGPVSDSEILSILGKMVKQRQESARTYEEGGRLELAEAELAEIGIIEDYLPRQLSEGEVEVAIGKAIEHTEANSIRDMGRVIGELKTRYTGQMDFAVVGPLVRDRLGA